MEDDDQDWDWKGSLIPFDGLPPGWETMTSEERHDHVRLEHERALMLMDQITDIWCHYISLVRHRFPHLKNKILVSELPEARAEFESLLGMLLTHDDIDAWEVRAREAVEAAARGER